MILGHTALLEQFLGASTKHLWTGRSDHVNQRSGLRSAFSTWLPPALSMLLIGWGANQFASMLALYLTAYGYTQLTVTSMLGIYVIGLFPALLIGGRLSDRMGRKPASVVALMITIIASVAMIIGAWSGLMIFLGRLLAGVATGLAMAVTSSWIKELSQTSSGRGATQGAGAQRASLFAAAGFWLGPVVSGVLAAFAPAPEVLPYAVHIILCLPLVGLLLRLPETTPTTSTGHTHQESGPGAYSGASRRFWTIVGPGAPWVFGAGSIGFAVVPGLMTSLGDQLLIYSTAAVALTLGCGVLLQPLAKKLDRTDSARASLCALGLTLAGLGAGITAGAAQLPWLGLASSALLGAGYGLMLVAGMLETQRTTAPQHLGAAMGRFYALAYAGYLAPTILAFFALWVAELLLLGLVAVLALVSVAVISVNSSKNLRDTELQEQA